MLKRVNLSEMAGAAFVILLGVFVMVIGSGYSAGTLSRMGPGYFPLVLGVLLIGLGLALVLEVWRAPRENTIRLPLHPLLMIGTGVICFAFLVERAGIVPAICALVGLSSLAESMIRPGTAIAIAVVMSLMGVFLFVRLLGLPLSAFGA